MGRREVAEGTPGRERPEIDRAEVPRPVGGAGCIVGIAGRVERERGDASIIPLQIVPDRARERVERDLLERPGLPGRPDGLAAWVERQVISAGVAGHGGGLAGDGIDLTDRTVGGEQVAVGEEDQPVRRDAGSDRGDGANGEGRTIVGEGDLVHGSRVLGEVEHGALAGGPAAVAEVRRVGGLNRGRHRRCPGASRLDDGETEAVIGMPISRGVWFALPGKGEPSDVSRVTCRL